MGLFSKFEIKSGHLIRYHGREKVVEIPETVHTVDKGAFSSALNRNIKKIQKINLMNFWI